MSDKFYVDYAQAYAAAGSALDGEEHVQDGGEEVLLVWEDANLYAFCSDDISVSVVRVSFDNDAEAWVASEKLVLFRGVHDALSKAIERSAAKFQEARDRQASRRSGQGDPA